MALQGKLIRLSDGGFGFEHESPHHEKPVKHVMVCVLAAAKTTAKALFNLLTLGRE